jgi:hypothetical protein
MFTSRPVLKRKTLAPKNDSRVPAGRAESTNQLKLSYLGRFRVSSPEPEVLTVDGESVVASMRTELSHISSPAICSPTRRRASSPLIQNCARPTALTWPCDTSASLRASALLPELRSSLTAVKLAFRRFSLMTGVLSAGAPAIRARRRSFRVRPITLRGQRK